MTLLLSQKVKFILHMDVWDTILPTYLQHQTHAIRGHVNLPLNTEEEIDQTKQSWNFFFVNLTGSHFPVVWGVEDISFNLTVLMT